jgi:hypothetical protein
MEQALVEEAKTCAADERKRLEVYLEQEGRCGGHGNWLARLISDGAELRKGELQGVRTIGITATCWEKLPEGGRLVRIFEAISELSRTEIHNDGWKDIATIREFQRLLPDRLENANRVVAVRNATGLVIFDGTKRAIAHYEYAVERSLQDYSLPLYLITSEFPDVKGDLYRKHFIATP